MILGCVPGSKSRRLDQPRDVDTAWEGRTHPWLSDELIALKAPWVAYLENFAGVDTGVEEVGVLNLRSGGFRHCDIGPWSSNGSFFYMTGIVVTNQGSVAWIGEERDWPHFEKEVFACESGHPRQLAQGQSITLHSLRLHEPFVSWTNGSRTESARLK